MDQKVSFIFRARRKLRNFFVCDEFVTGFVGNLRKELVGVGFGL